MGWIPPKYQTVTFQNPNAPGGYTIQQVMTQPGYTDNTAQLQYNADIERINAMQALASQMPKAPTYDPTAAANAMYAERIAPQIANYQAQLGHAGMDNSTFGAGLLSQMATDGARQAADYGNTVAVSNYSNALGGWNALAGLTNNIGNLTSQKATDLSNDYGQNSQQQAYGNFQPANSNNNFLGNLSTSIANVLNTI